MRNKIIIIGAGLGGLAASVLLAKEGHQVTVLEKNEAIGGKMNQISENGYRFDTGPSLLTMPEIIDSLFEKCGRNREDYLTFLPVSPLCRYFFPDGTKFNNYSDRENNAGELLKIAPEEVENYNSFLSYASELYNKTSSSFLNNPLYDLSDLKQLNLIDFFGIDAFTTVASRVDSSFRSPYLRQFFKRFTTYNGSSPFQAPATLNVIPHVEINMGGYYVKGGLYSIAKALGKLAREFNVEFQFKKEVQKINCTGKRVKAVTLTDGSELKTDIIVSNSDASETLLELLPKESLSHRKRRKQENLEPSCSGFVLLLGISKKFKTLAHHNIFFSSDYQSEFNSIFNEKKLPDDPTIYVANTSYSDPAHAPNGHSNLFILVNAPYLTEDQNWESLSRSYPDLIISKLENSGLTGLMKSVKFSKIITPEDFYRNYRSNRGSIYGTSSNSKFSAFRRPKNKTSFIDGLYLTGGSTHPGGGIPLVLLSAFHAVSLIQRYEK